MGGKAFPDLSIPRLPPELYYKLVAEYQLRLRRIFGVVASPISGPAKTSHGDIDFLVTCPEQEMNELAIATKESKAFELSKQNAHLQEVQKTFGCERALYHGSTASFAVPHPDSGRNEEFVQLDVQICESVVHLEWVHFHHSHGDIWNIFGTSLRPFGFTATDKGLYVRDPVIEEVNRNMSRNFLTNDPRRVLKFLGVSEEEYFGVERCDSGIPGISQDGDNSNGTIDSDGETRTWQESEADHFDSELSAELQKFQTNLTRRERGERALMEFKSDNDLFAYVVTCRFFRKEWYVRDTLKANDRQRLEKRDLFRKFVNEYIPTLPDSDEVQYSREELKQARKSLCEEALKEFGREQEFYASRQVWENERKVLHDKKILRIMKEAESYPEVTYSNGWMRFLGGEWDAYMERKDLPKLPTGWDRGWIEGREDCGWE